jgi:hypothetical protein
MQYTHATWRENRRKQHIFLDNKPFLMRNNSTRAIIVVHGMRTSTLHHTKNMNILQRFHAFSPYASDLFYRAMQ